MTDKKYNIEQVRGAFGAGAYKGNIKRTSQIVTKWFHSYHDDGAVRWQGRIIAEQGDGYFVVQLYSWIMGEPTDQAIVHISDMKDWSFYTSNEDMKNEYSKKETK